MELSLNSEEYDTKHHMFELSPNERTPWQLELRESLRNVSDLLAHGLIREDDLSAFERVLRKYDFFLPRYYANLIDRNNPHCPIRAQAIPSLLEYETSEEESSDPLNDLKYRPVERVTHRYRNRALLHPTQNCSMYCRFCFRKTLLNELSPELFSGSLEPAYAYFSSHPEIEEVILSGGDPFFVTDVALKDILLRLDQISHVKRVRVHTRVPVTFPMRVTRELVHALTNSRFLPTVVMHFNHPKELTLVAGDAVQLLKQAGLPLLNQSVLLRGVNDSAEVLSELNERIFELGVLPYYIHQLDASRGTSHFKVPISEGMRIFSELRQRLPGYLVPRYVWDDGGSMGKRDVTLIDEQVES